jgi:HPt (histidine-containing phosphotransfer) domain-containing protein
MSQTTEEAHHLSSEPPREGFEPLLQQYVAELPQRAEAIASALQAGDATQTKELLHQLAGSLGLYGYRRLEGNIRAVLARLREGEALPALSSELERVQQELNRVRARPAL